MDDQQIESLPDPKEQAQIFFNEVDMHKSGQINKNQIIELCQILGSEVTEQQLNDIFDNQDSSNSLQWTFDEFWTWFQYGREGPLSKIFNFQIKLLNRLEKHQNQYEKIVNFKDQVSNKKVDHQISLFNGEKKFNFGLIFEVILSSDTSIVQDHLLKIHPDILSPVDSFQFIVKLSIGQEQEQIKSNLESAIKEILGLNQELEKIVKFEILKHNQHIIVVFDFQHPLINQIIKNKFSTKIEKLSNNFEFHLNNQLFLTLGLDKLFFDQTPFVKYLASGFQNHLRLRTNKDIFKNIYDSFRDNHHDKLKQFKSFLNIPQLLNQSHITFKLKDIKEVDQFFDSLGLTELLVDQPNGKELLKELVSELGLEFANQKSDIFHFIYSLFQQIEQQKEKESDISFNFVLPNIFTKVELVGELGLIKQALWD